MGIHSTGVYEIVPMQDRKDAGEKLMGLIWVDKSLDPTRKKKFDRDHVPGNRRRRSKARFKEPHFASQLFRAMPPLESVKALVSIMMSVSWSNKRKPLKLRHYHISQAHFQRTAQRLMYIRFPAEDRQKCGEDKVGR